MVARRELSLRACLRAMSETREKAEGGEEGAKRGKASPSSPPLHESEASFARENAIHHSLCPMNIRLRISSAFMLLCMVLNLVACAVLLGWLRAAPDAPPGGGVRCIEREHLFLASQVALSVARLGFMAASALLTYQAGKAAASEALMASTRTSRSIKETQIGRKCDSRALVSARCLTQVRYDRVLVLNAFVEPAFSLVQVSGRSPPASRREGQASNPNRRESRMTVTTI